jgi:hypothetical protein
LARGAAARPRQQRHFARHKAVGGCRHAYVIVDGTLIPVDRVAADRPFCSGQRKKHGMNLQVIASARGRHPVGLGSAAPARSTMRGPSGSGACSMSWRKRAWSPWPTGDTRAVPERKPRTRGRTSQNRRKKPTAPTRTPRPGERANAQLKTWDILDKLRCCPWKAGQLAKAIHALRLCGAQSG